MQANILREKREDLVVLTIKDVKHMGSLDAIIKNWPVKSDHPDEVDEKRIIKCKQNFETEYVIRAIIQSHPHIDRELIINAMKVCCKEIAEPYYPRPFLICLLRRLGIS